MEDRLPRKLAAILYADVVGYSRLTGEDEEGTHRRLAEHLDFISGEVERYEGKVIHYAGDAVLADFGTVTDALICATSIQNEFSNRNRGKPEARAIQFRIGINLGEVIVDRNEIYGDGVNVAARLESLADAGGVCIAESVRTSIGNKLPLDYEFMGEQTVKNIKEPIRAYQVRIRSVEPPVHSSLDLPELELPDNPSIAVLPFTNMSGDPEQEYFSDGITEDIITALSKIKSLLVVARNSTFTYKGQAVDVRKVSQEQGVRYVLEGSVRKAGSRVRITAQLLDATTGHHVWAERYDRNLEDIFAVQDEVTREVVIALDIQLSAGEQARFWASGTKNLEAWEYIRRCMDLLNSGNPERLQEAERLCQSALALDPDYAMGWVTMGWIHHHSVDVGVRYTAKESKESVLGKGLECGDKALELDPSCADAYALLGHCFLGKGDYDQAVAMSERAVSLAPNHADNLALASIVQAKSGRLKGSLELITKAMRLCPNYPGWFCWALGTLHRLMGDTDLAVPAFEAAIKREADFLSLHVGLASAYGELDQQKNAKKSASEVLRLAPDFSIKEYIAGLSYKDPRELVRFENGLHKAGLPE